MSYKTYLSANRTGFAFIQSDKSGDVISLWKNPQHETFDTAKEIASRNLTQLLLTGSHLGSLIDTPIGD